MFTAKSRQQMASAVKFASKYRLRELIAFVLGVVSAGVGISFIVNPDAHRTATYSVATDWADPRVAGVVLVILIMLGLLSFLTDHMKVAAIICLLLMVYYFSFAVAILLAVAGGGVPAAIWPYMGYGLVSLIVLCACLFGSEDD